MIHNKIFKQQKVNINIIMYWLNSFVYFHNLCVLRIKSICDMFSVHFTNSVGSLNNSIIFGKIHFLENVQIALELLILFLIDTIVTLV